MQPAGGGGFKFKLKVKGAGESSSAPPPQQYGAPGAYPQPYAQQQPYGAPPGNGYGDPLGLKRQRPEELPTSTPVLAGAYGGSGPQAKRANLGDGGYSQPAPPPMAFASHGGGVPLPAPSAAGAARPTLKVKVRTASSALGSTPSLDPGSLQTPGGSGLYGRPPAGPSRQPAIGGQHHPAAGPANVYQQQQQQQQHYAPYGQQHQPMQGLTGAAAGGSAWGASPFAPESSRQLNRKDVEREQKAKEREQAKQEREEQKRREKEEANERKRQAQEQDQLAAVMGAAFGVGRQSSSKVKIKFKAPSAGGAPAPASSMGPPPGRMPSLATGGPSQHHQQQPGSSMHQPQHDLNGAAGWGGAAGAAAPTPSSGSVPRYSTSIRIKVGGMGAARPSGALPTPSSGGMLDGIPMQPMMPYTGTQPHQQQQQQQQQQKQAFDAAAATLNSILQGASAGPGAPDTDAATAAALDGILQRHPSSTPKLKLKPKIKAVGIAASPGAGSLPPAKRLKHQEGAASGASTPTAAGVQQPAKDKPASKPAAAMPRPAKLERLVALFDKVLDGVAKKDEGQNNVFKRPVSDEVAPGYSNVVKEPMCFDTMREKLRTNQYTSWEAFEYDMALVFDNAQAYNPAGSFIHHHAAYLRDVAAKYAGEAKRGNTNFRGVAAGITRRYMAIWSKEHPNTIPPTAASHAAAKAAAVAAAAAEATEALRGPAQAGKERQGVMGSSQAYGRGHRQHANVSYAVDLDEQRPSGRQGTRGGRGGRRGGAHGSAHSHAAMAARRTADPDARRMAAVYVRRSEQEDLRDTYTLPANHTILPVANWRGLAGGANVEGTEFGSGPFALRCLWPGAIPAPAALPGSAGAPDRSNFNGNGLPLDAYTRSVARFVRGWHPALRRAVLADRVVPCVAVEDGQLRPQPAAATAVSTGAPGSSAPPGASEARGGGGGGGSSQGQQQQGAPGAAGGQQQGGGTGAGAGPPSRATPFGAVASLPAGGGAGAGAGGAQPLRPSPQPQQQIQPPQQHPGATQAPQQGAGAAAPQQQQQAARVQQSTPPPQQQQQPLVTQETIVVDDDDGSPLPDLPPATP